MKSLSKPERIQFGRVLKPHGLRGELVVVVDPPELFSSLEWVWVEISPNQYRAFRIEEVRPYRGKHSPFQFFLKLEDVLDRTMAEALTGRVLWISRADLPPLEEGEYYAFELMGMEVHSEDGRFLGHVSEIWLFPAQTVLEIQPPEGDAFLLPMVKPFIDRIDRLSGVMRVRLPEDLPDAP